MPTGVLTLALLALLLPSIASARHDHRKVYVFVIDGLDGDALADGTAPTIASLIDGEKGAGTTYFPRSRSVMVAETNPNHTSMITGALPRKHGITGNEFAVYGDIPDEDSCPRPRAIDESGPPNATSGESAPCVEVENLFETIATSRNPRHITTALIAGKPKLARLFATQGSRNSRYDADHIWAPCDENEPYCTEVPTNPVTGYAASDSIVMDEVIRTTRERVADRGRKRRPDFTFVNFPQVDSAGHAAGPSSALYDETIGLADAEIKRFVANQKALGLWERTFMMIVSDHSMDDTPLINKVSIADSLVAGGVPAERFEVVGNGSAAHVYLTERQASGAGVLLKRMRAVLTAVPGVDDVLYRRRNPADGGTRFALRHAKPGWGLAGPRAGDIVLTTSPGIGVRDTSEIDSLPFDPLPGTHGGPQTADNSFLISGGHRAIRQGTSGARASNADVNPTAMALLERRPARAVQGEFLDEAFRLRRLEKRR